jgi:glycosyltransferase involved in cell wall biosynthesis/2-polyprenyl-3-methyl-5-hydroxy-6-metoxy-1,4-benzoquinol methylase
VGDDLRVLLQRPAPDYFGGGVLHVDKTQEALAALGIEVDQTFDLEPDLAAYDVVHLFNTPKTSDLLVQCANAQRYCRPLVLSSIYWDEPRLFECMAADQAIPLPAKLDRALLSQLYAAALGEADVVLTASEMEAGWLTRDFGLTGDRQRVVPLGADPMFARADGGEFRTRHGLSDFVLCAAVLGRSKNQLRLIEALRGLDTPLVLAYTHAEAEYERRCRDAAGDNVMFIGALDQSDLASAYAAAKVHALVSCYEPTGLATLEAGLAGCNLVCTAHSPIAEYVGNRAWYADPLDLASIRRAVELALRVPRSYVLRNELLLNFTWERTARLTLAVYEGLLAVQPGLAARKGETRYRWLIAFRARVEESRSAGGAMASAALAARDQAAAVHTSADVGALTRALHERDAQLEGVTHTWGYRLYHRVATSAPARLLRRLRNPGPPPVFAAPRGPALDSLASSAAHLKRALVIAEASAWHVRRALADLRRALPEAHIMLAGSEQRLASARAGFDVGRCAACGPVLSLTRRGYSELTGLYDVIIVVGEVSDEAVALAHRTGAKIVVQYNAGGYFAGSAVIAEPEHWRRVLRAAALRRPLALWLVWIFGHVYRAYLRAWDALRRKPRIGITCLGCGASGLAPVHWGPRQDAPFVTCSRCGLVQASRVATSSEVTGIYEDAQALQGYLEVRGEPVTRARHEGILEHIQAWTRPGRILDVGCADGRFLEVARDGGWQVEGIEGSDMLARMAQEAVPEASVHRGLLGRVGLPAERYQAINLCHIVEHVTDVPALLRACRAALRPGGILCVVMPNLESLAALITKDADERCISLAAGHVTLPTARMMTAMLRREGFQVVERGTMASGRMFRTRWTARVFRFLPALMRRVIETREPQLNEYLAQVGMGEELLVIARKPG